MTQTKRILGLIPARYASTRLPGKPLVDLCGKPMIQWVYELASEALEHVYVATDDERIAEVVAGFGGKYVMTNTNHSTGTNRCLEAYESVSKELNSEFDIIINIQGDEPLLNPGDLKAMVDAFDDESTELSTLVLKVSDERDLSNEGEAFVTLDKSDNALYFSRFPIPFLRGVPKGEWLQHHEYIKHLGMYTYSPTALRDFAEMTTSSLEKAESLEQLRWLEAGRKIKCAFASHDSIPVDTPADAERVRSILRERGYKG